MPDPFRRAVQTAVGNPFAVSANRWHEAAETLRQAPVRDGLTSLARSGRLIDAKRLLLAIGHLQAIAQPRQPRGVLGAALFPPSLSRRLPRKRHAYLRVVMAAGRCFEALNQIRGRSAATRQLKRETWAACFGDSLLHALNLERVIRDHDVLILGETGTGKEAIARAIQVATLGPDGGSPASSSAINAAAIPETLIESELFGHVKGAFTGADEARVGRIRVADGGSFFLDEVGDLRGTTQVKLLRVMETNEVSPLGSDQSHHSDVRYIAATHAALERSVEHGGFRRDLYERLAGIVIRIPPLRARSEDIIDIGRDFIARYLPEHFDLDRDLDGWLARAAHAQYSWPGNVRELQNAIRSRLLGLSTAVSAPPGESAALTDAPSPSESVVPKRIVQGKASRSELDAWYLRRVLATTEGNYAMAARVLGVDRSTVRRQARVLGL